MWYICYDTENVYCFYDNIYEEAVKKLSAKALILDEQMRLCYTIRHEIGESAFS